MTSYEFQKLLGFFGEMLVVITKIPASCGEDFLMRIDMLAVAGNENYIRRLLVVVESTRVGVSEGSRSKELGFWSTLPECDLVTGGDAIERHGVRFVRLQRSGVSVGANEEKLKRKREEWNASGKMKL